MEGWLLQADAMLREMKPLRGDRAVAAAEDEVDLVGGDERVSLLLVSDSWLSQSLGGKRFVAAEHVKQLGVDVLLRLGCERFSIETFLKLMENKEDATVESGNPGQWLREAAFIASSPHAAGARAHGSIVAIV